MLKTYRITKAYMKGGTMIKFENTEVVGWEHAIRGM